MDSVMTNETASTDSGLRTLISRQNAKKMFVSELKNTRFGCCCCNLWIAAHFWMIWDILYRLQDSGKYMFMDWSEFEHPIDHKNIIVYDLVMIPAAAIGLYGLRVCKPECIGTFVLVANVVLFRASISIIGTRLVEGRFMTDLGLAETVGLFVFAWFWYGWMTLVFQRVYKVARKHRYGTDRYRPDISSIVQQASPELV